MDGRTDTGRQQLLRFIRTASCGKNRPKSTKMSEGKLMQSCAMAVADLQQNIKYHFVT